MGSICENCKASKRIKNTLGCNCDRIHNDFEIIRSELCKGLKINYTPRFHCRFVDLVEEERVNEN